MKLHKVLSIFTFLLLVMASASRADDTEIFNNPGSGTVARPNVLIVLDNTANWSTPFDFEILALKTVIESLTDSYNVGLMMFTESGGANKGPDGGYVRYAMRQMTTTNKAALATLINGFNKVNDRSNNGKSALTMYEAHQYFANGASYAGGPAGNNLNGKVKSDSAAFATGTANYFMDSQTCGNNYIIYISNGPVQDNANDTATATTKLSSLGGNTTSIAISPNGSQSNVSDEFSRYMASSGYSIVTYTVDVLPGTTGQGPGWTRLMQSMASESSGKYFSTNDLSSLTIALNQIFTEVQAVNSVFASSTLPVSINVRGSYLNQVYMGVFRPDGNSSPRWAGNLKKYSLAPDASDNLILVDKVGFAVENASTGFISPLSQSFWTTSSTFWTSTYYPAVQASGGISDLPDGDLVEKGGAAQKLRTAYSTDLATRNLYTCTGSCVANSLLSSTPFADSNVNITQAGLGAASTTERTQIINWIRGQNNKSDDNPSALSTSVRGYVHGDVLHARPAVVNYNRYGDDRDVMIYYGANDGIFHAIKGGSDDADGIEKWGFVPSEFFPTLKRLRDATPIIDTTNTKPYFADGPIGIYQLDANNDGRYTSGDGSGDKVYLFIGMRRGGRIYYALDVTNPDAPVFLWKITGGNADDFQELGQSWSEPQVATIRLTSQASAPVLIFGLGYDAPANDPSTQGTATMGRGVMMVDATTGALIWQTGPKVSTGATYLQTSGMTYAIPANLTVVDSNLDGKADRIYAADTGANIWRINIHDIDKANWTVTKLAALGGNAAANRRKFLFAPDVVLAGVEVTHDSILIGSGDREHPFDTTIANRYYMIKDDSAVNAVRGTTITEGTTTANVNELLDVTTNMIQTGTDAQRTAAAAALASAAGWYIQLSAGEKVVSGSTTLGGTTFFGTNIPATYAASTCTGNLGEARLYGISYTDGSATTDYNADGSILTADRYQVRPGGGYPPTPVPVSVRIDGKDYQAVISGTKVVNPGGTVIGRRYRTYWQRLID